MDNISTVLKYAKQTTYLPLVDIGEGILLLYYGKICIPLIFPVPPTYLLLSTQFVNAPQGTPKSNSSKQKPNHTKNTFFVMHFTVIYPQLYNQLLTRERVCQQNIFSILNNDNNCERKLESTVLNSMIRKNFCNLYPQKSGIAGKYARFFL